MSDGAEGSSLIAEFLDGMPLAAFTLDPRDIVTAANVPALAVLGERARGRNLALSLRGPELLEAVAAVRHNGAQQRILLRLPDEAQFRVKVSNLPGATPPLVLCVMQDVTSEAQNEAIRREFVANVSHELRTPLTAMMGFIETLQTAAKDDPAARTRFLDIMSREAGRMNRLVRDLLQLSRVEAEERVRPRESVDLPGILRAAAASVRQIAEEHGSPIVITGIEGRVMVPGDPDQLTQVFLNLMENAVKYGAKGKPVTVTLSRETTSRGEAIRVDVADQGDGIDQIHLPRLTERFYRVDTHRSRAEGGTGLGLAIVKHIINRHRGWLRIDSEKGRGSVFSVILPES
ncbi:two-component sensor histidine kinase [Xinfangfangia sp. D13-10-4-6]|uniref:sensor histidine kinase n=1 Tax=Pseudogemmobacter hezensis TaxID=2737662 RepID=UPI001554D694|nr:ATP-binding protein [Pseudogemmobacter hezensis]NPD15833.1 two-component sensor histidine kinase [Pseudogemmobacter hezensis]